MDESDARDDAISSAIITLFNPLDVNIWSANVQDHIIQFSMDDVIGILESAPVRPDMIGEITIAQVMNRAPMAHLSIERALKFLIRKSGLNFKEDHNLHTHLETLRLCDTGIAEYLDLAFDAAVQFYGLNTNRGELKHLRSLHTYLSLTGTAAAFDKMRYWELDQSPDELIGRIWLPIHLEILRALREVYLSGGERSPETVVERVERTVHRAMWPMHDLAYSPGSAKEAEVNSYVEWLKSHTSFREALAEAVRSGFSVGSALTNQVVSRAYDTLCQSQDPAVLYLTTRLDVLPSQPRAFIPEVEWLGGQTERSGIVKTPSGHSLGFIDRSADGIWHITPSRGGPVRVAARAATQMDARCLLAQLLTAPADLTVGKLRTTARLIGEDHNRIQRNHLREQVDHATNEQVGPWSHKLEFWDTGHSIAVGQEITIEVNNGHQDNIVHVLEGRVSGVEGHVVYVVGHDYLDLATPGERADNGQAMTTNASPTMYNAPIQPT